MAAKSSAAVTASISWTAVPENPLEFGKVGSTTMLHRQRPKTNDDRHVRSFCLDDHPSAWTARRR